MQLREGRPMNSDTELWRGVSRRRALQVGGAGLATTLVGLGSATARRAEDVTPETAAAEQFSPQRQPGVNSQLDRRRR